METKSGDLIGPKYKPLDGPLGMPGPIGLDRDGNPGETDEEHAQRWRDAIAHNERYFAKHPKSLK